VTVTRVLVETEVGHEDDVVAKGVTQRSKRHLRDALRVPRGTSELVLGLGYTKKNDAADAGTHECLHFVVE